MHVIGLMALGNFVSILYVPQNGILLRGSMYVGTPKVEVAFYGNATKGALCTFPASVVLGSGSMGRMSPDLVRDNVYVYYQKREPRITCVLQYSSGPSPTSTDSATMQFGVSDLSEDVSIVYNFFGRHLMYFGAIPESYLSHMTIRGNLSLGGPTLDLSALPILLRNGTTLRAAKLSAAHWDHVIASTDCGVAWTIAGSDVSIQTACVAGMPGGETIVSLRALGAGIHVTADRVMLVTPNNHEYDYVTAWTTLAILMFYFGTWLMWTRDFPEQQTSAKYIRTTWVRITVNSAPITVAMLLLILTRNMWAAAQKSHGMYNIETIDMIGMDALEIYIMLYAFVFTPLIVGSALLIVAYGNHRYGVKTSGPTAWLSWNSPELARFHSGIRGLVFVGLYALAAALVFLMWKTTNQSTGSTILSAVYVSITLAYWSSSAQIHVLMRPLFDAMVPHDRMLLAYLSWVVRVLILTAIPPNTPYAIDSAYALRFHTFISMGAGILVAETIGRTVNLFAGNLEDYVVFFPFAAFAFSFAVLFGFGSLYGSTGALRSEPDLTLLCSFTLGYTTTGAQYLFMYVAPQGLLRFCGV